MVVVKFMPSCRRLPEGEFAGLQEGNREARLSTRFKSSHPLAMFQNQFGTQAAALISPNSRAILHQDAPAPSVTYTSPNRLNATMRLASAGCVARPHMVALGWVGSGRISQVSPKFVVRSTCPFSPVVVSPHPANSTPGSSALTIRPRA